MNVFKLFGALVLGSFLSACGGGGSTAGSSPLGGGSGSGLGGTVSGASASTVKPSLTLAISSTTATAAVPATVTATLRDAAGVGIAGQVISFSTAGSLGSFNVSTALTDTTGNAAVKLSPTSSSSNGADLVLAQTSVGGNTISGTIGFQVTAGSGSSTPAGFPSISLTLSTNAVTTATPAVATVIVKDANGVPLSGQVVKFSTAAGNIGSFQNGSALTDPVPGATPAGIATGKLNPASPSANGADLAIAQVTVNGTLVTATVGFSVTSTGAPAVGVPSMSLSLSTTTVTTATPALVTVAVRDATGAGVAGQVVKFSTVDGLGVFPVTSSLTNALGVASATLTAVAAGSSGADQVLAKTTVNGTSLQASQGFQLTAASVTVATFTSDIATVPAYGQSNLSVVLAGINPGTPVTVAVSSACVAKGKASLTPAFVSTTTGQASFTYRDNGCGQTDVADSLQASVAGTAATANLTLALTSPAVTSIAFISATPQSIFLKGSGFVEIANVVFQVLDTGGKGFPGQTVVLDPSTLTGGLTIDDGPGPVTKLSDSSGNVSVRIKSGTVPTPVRVRATVTIAGVATSTVSNSLSIAVGLPSQLNFSLSQTTLNIEGFDIDGTPNTYSIIASDRLGNPVPAGTAVNFFSPEGGQVEAIKFTTLTGGLARTSAAFVSSSPRPADGRVTVLAYALGEESFLDLNGNNVWDLGEPFQDLGNVFLDRQYDNFYDAANDQYIALSLPGAVVPPAACVVSSSPLLQLDTSIPSAAVFPDGTPACDGTWGRAYVRRAAETVFSTSTARPLWFAPPSGLYSLSGAVCPKSTLITSYNSSGNAVNGAFYRVGGATALYNLPASGVISFLAADANSVRLNPMAAGTIVTVGATAGLAVSVAGGSPVPSTNSATFATVALDFTAPTTSGVITVNFTSPSGLTTSVNQLVSMGAPGGATACP